MKETLVTVLMSVYNGEKYLAEAMESIMGQTYRDFEFIIIDDGSTDTSANIIASYSDPRIRLVKNEANIGLTRSLNKGIALAKGKYIARMDADDISLPERLEKQVEFMEANQDVAVCGTKGIVINDHNEATGLIEPLAYTHSAIMNKLLLMNQFVHPSVIISKQVLIAVGCYNTKHKYAQDYFLWITIASEGYELANLEVPLIRYRLHDDRISVKSIDEQEKAACIIIKIGFKLLLNMRVSLRDIALYRRIIQSNAEGLSPKKVKNIMEKYHYLFDHS